MIARWNRPQIFPLRELSLMIKEGLLSTDTHTRLATYRFLAISGAIRQLDSRCCGDFLKALECTRKWMEDNGIIIGQCDASATLVEDSTLTLPHALFYFQDENRRISQDTQAHLNQIAMVALGNDFWNDLVEPRRKI